MTGTGRHRDLTDSPRWSRILGKILPRVDRPLYTSIIVGIGFGAVIWISSAHDVTATRGWPGEHAKVLSIKEHGGFLSPCGKGGGRAKDITWQSPASPSGLPSIFVDKGECLDTSVGESWTVVRVVDKKGEVDVFVNPTRTYSEAAEDTLIATALAFGVVIMTLMIRLWWIDRRNRD